MYYFQVGLGLNEASIAPIDLLNNCEISCETNESVNRKKNQE